MAEAEFGLTLLVLAVQIGVAPNQDARLSFDRYKVASFVLISETHSTRQREDLSAVTSYDYTEAVADLRRAFAQEESVLLTGSGVSVAATGGEVAASWRGLLELGIQRATQVNEKLPESWATLASDELRLGFESNHLDSVLSVAEKVERALKVSDGEFARWLADTVGSLQIQAPSLLDAIAKLSSPTFTTNYDTLLDEHIGAVTIGPNDTFAVQRVLRREDFGVVHVHGHWRQPKSVVLGIRSYDRILDQASIQAVLRTIFVSRTVVMVGFAGSLNDPNFDALRDYLRPAIKDSGYRHYLLMRNADSIEGIVLDDRIHVLRYGDHFNDLPHFLESCSTSTTAPVRLQSGANPTLFQRATEFVLDEIRDNSVLLEHLDSVEDRPLDALVLAPVLLPITHEQYVLTLRDPDETKRPQRIRPSEDIRDYKYVTITGSDGSGLTTALQWTLLQATRDLEDVPPIYLDFRTFTTKRHTLFNEVVASLQRLGYQGSRKDPLPDIAIAIDNVIPQGKVFQRMLDQLETLPIRICMFGCKEGDEGALVSELSHRKSDAAVWYLGRLSDRDVTKLAALIHPSRADQIATQVVEVLMREHFPRTPWIICLLLSTLLHGETLVAASSETALLDAYVTTILGRGSPLDDARFDLSSSDREEILALMAEQFVRSNRSSIPESTCIELLEHYFEAVRWREDPIAVLRSFLAVRVLRASNGRVTFTQHAFLSLFAAKRAMDDPVFREFLYQDPLRYGPVLRHYAALSRKDAEVLRVVQRMLLASVAPPLPPPVGPFATDEANVRSRELKLERLELDPEATDDSDDEGADERESAHQYLEILDSIDAEPFPEADASSRDPATQMDLLGLASRVVRDSVAVTDRTLKQELLQLLLSRWGLFAEDLWQDDEYMAVMRHLGDVLVEAAGSHGDKAASQRADFEAATPLMGAVAGLAMFLRSKKLVVLLDELFADSTFMSDPRGAGMAAALAFVIHEPGWAEPVAKCYLRHQSARGLEVLLFSLLLASYYVGDEANVDLDSMEAALAEATAGPMGGYKSSGERAGEVAKIRQRLTRARIGWSQRRLPKGSNVLDAGTVEITPEEPES